MATSPGNSGVNEVISLAFGAAGESHDAISLPTVMLPRRWFGEAKGVDLVEAIKYWFEQHGFSAERSYHDGMHGYTGLFRELGGWYPWDIETIRQAHKDELLERRRVREALPQLALPESLEAIIEESFQGRLRLVQAMDEEQFPILYEAIFNSWEDDEEGHVIDDGGPPRVGAPDLFVWHS